RFMLRPGRIASPAPARAFTFELSPPESPHEGVEYNYAGKSANSRGRTCTGKTSSIMGCEQRPQRASVTSVLSLLRRRSTRRHKLLAKDLRGTTTSHELVLQVQGVVLHGRLAYSVAV